MKKIINAVDDVVEEMLEGIAKAHPELVHRVEGTRVIARNYDGAGKVAIISGGGSGHEPSHAGFVGRGMLSAAVSGDVFTSPTPDQVLEAIKAADRGAGVFLDIKNYTGDVLNFEMAADMARDEGIKVDEIVIGDDIAVENSLYTAGRRGVAGTLFFHKILGALAERGGSLEEIKKTADALAPEIKTIGVALHAATTPALGKPGFDLAEDEMEYGVGIHSEPGYRREKMKSSKEMAAELVEKLNEEFKFKKDEKVVVMVNGMGGTPLSELYIFANDTYNLLDKLGVKVAKSFIGNFMTSLDMTGLSLTLFRITDPVWFDLLTDPCETPAWTIVK